MKWIGQNIQSFISRFRSDVYLEDLTTTTDTNVLVVDSNDKVCKNTTTLGGDLTAIVAGTNLSGSSLSGPIPTINLDNPIAGPFEIEQGASGGGTALLIDNDDVDQNAFRIDAANTTVNAAVITATALTSAQALSIVDGNNDTGNTLKLTRNTDVNLQATSNISSAMLIDYTKNGVTGASTTHKARGLYIDVDDSATNNAAATVFMYGASIAVDSANSQGSIVNTGLEIDVAGADSNFGIDIEVDDSGGGTGADIIMRNGSHYCTHQVGSNGATTITTVDGSGAAAHFEVDADGDIILDSAGQIKLEPVAGNNILLDGTVTVDGGAVGGLASLTSSADLNIVATGNDITVDSDTVTVTSSTADQPIIKVLNTTDDDQASQLIFEKLRDDDAVASGQNLGEIWFKGQDNAQNAANYAVIYSEIDVSTHGQESGILKFAVANHDNGIGTGLTLTGGSVNNEIDATVGLGTASVTTIAGTLTMGSTAALTNAGLLGVTNQTGLVGTGALNSGTITSGFGNINNGSSTLTSNGAINFGGLPDTAGVDPGVNGQLYVTEEGVIMVSMG